ncbi:unnamed protein product [Lymnaea stagnalis]|uniref:Uncharacterized protein n=1 Tax=Lymnaea stagnalis TaxID=6523 RepID=A0AAV2H1I5_LYMST
MHPAKATDFLTSALICLTLCQLVTLTSCARPRRSHGHGHHTGYGILVDAGSSSSKLNIYRWDPPTPHKHVPNITLLSSERIKPGLDHFVNDQRNRSAYLEGILARAKKRIPQADHAKTPIFLMATAGVRKLTASDATRLLDGVRSVLANTTASPFLYSPSRVNVLSGEEEGVYSWIAANYLLGFFDKENPINKSTGVLEMGGGSTQITFIPTEPLYAGEFQVTVAGIQYQLYVQSYLQYGANEIKLKVAQQLLNRKPGVKEVDNPCVLTGDKDKVKLEDGITYSMKGTGSPSECQEILKTILKPWTGMDCQPKPCAIGPVYQPSVSGKKFFATQAYTYAPKNLQALPKDGVLNIDRLEQAAFKHCNKSMNEIASNKTEYASDDCLMALYIPTLLTLSYGFSRNTSSIKMTSSIANQSIDWTLGAMLVELSNTFDRDKAAYGVTCRPATAAGGKGVDMASRENSSAKPLQAFSSVLALSISFVVVFIC